VASRRTWIVLGALGAGVAVLLVAAGAAVYFVTQHVETRETTSADALRALDEVRTSFGDQRPLYEFDQDDEPRAVRPLRELPTAPSTTTSLQILAWDPDDQRTVRLSLPFWVLRLGKSDVSVVSNNGSRFTLEQLDLDVDELARVGPALVVDYRGSEGVRVMVWTK
jgi:hypothetical protein